jgi:molecular chaperone GrpE
MTQHPERETPEETEGIRVHDRRRIDPDTFEVREPSAPAPEGGAEGAEGAAVEADLSATETKVAELTDDLRRVHAEYANYRKRVERDREAAREVVIAGVLADLLPVLDDIERAREHGELQGAFKTVGENLEQVTAKLGLERFGVADEPFDPTVHEALTSEQRDGIDEPTVVSVFQPGYRIGERIIRPARVAVAGTD